MTHAAPKNQTACELVEWLKKCPNVESAVPVIVTIKNRTWVGALYCETHELSSIAYVVKDGPMLQGQINRSYRLYCIGDRFKPVCRPDKWVATYDLPIERRQPLEDCHAATNEWYLACYSANKKHAGPDAERYNQYAPFGDFMILCLHQMMNFGCWKDWSVDTGEPQPYDRFTMDVRYL